MIYNYDESKVFVGPDGSSYIVLVVLDDNKVLASRVGDVGGGADCVPVYLMERT